jgi:hypothetical protein
VDPDRLALLALGEPADAIENSHVDQCAKCQVDLDALSTVADLGRQTEELTTLPEPPERMWRRIADVGLASDRHSPAPRAALVAPKAPLPGFTARLRGRWPVWAREVAIAGTAAFIAVLGTLAAVQALETNPPGPPQPVVAATAELAALPTAPASANGQARVLAGDRTTQLHLHVAGLPLRPGYYEVWLINPDSFQMVSIGTLADAGDDLLPLPSTIDLREFRLVDISAEEYDGNALHSGQSLLRGTLSG